MACSRRLIERTISFFQGLRRPKTIRSSYPDEYTWAKAALAFAQSRARTAFQVECLDDRKEIHIYLPDDLRQRLKRLPSEIQTEVKPGESIVVATGILPNRKGHPLIQRWAGTRPHLPHTLRTIAGKRDMMFIASHVA